MGLVSGSSGLLGRASTRADRDRPAPPPKRDKPIESPWRSRVYVTARHSADGNGYSPGEPIPRDEAVRQGVIVETTNGPRIGHPCPACEGTGKRAPKVARKHRPGCACPACRPCKRCDGTGEA